MNTLSSLQKLVLNDLSSFRYNYFPGQTKSFIYKGFNPKRGGNFEETRYKVQSLNFFDSFLFAGNVGGEKPSDYAKSVHLHNLLLQKEGIKAIAHGFDIESLFDSGKRISKEQPNFINFLEGVVKNAAQFLLLHVTDPFKTTAYDFALRNGISISESAKISCVVNPFLFDPNGDIYAENVDGYACMDSVKDWREIEGSTILLIGAGGAASSIALEAVQRIGEGKLIILNRTEEKAHKLAEKLRSYELTKGEIISGGTDLLKDNTNIDVVISAITENPYVTNSFAKAVPEKTLFVDINYGERASVAAIGRKTKHDSIDGIPMVYYGVERAAKLAFEKKLNKKVKKETFDFLKKEAGLK